MSPRIYTEVVTVGGTSIYHVTSDPNGVLQAARGSLAMDSSAPPNVWQNQDGGTTWATLGGGGSTAPSWFGTTLNAVPVSLFTDGIGATYNLPDNSAFKFSWQIVALSAAGDVAGFQVSGVIKRGAGAVTTALVGAPVLESTGSDASLAGATVTAVADAVNGALAPQVTGVAATTINWMVTMASFSQV